MNLSPEMSHLILEIRQAVPAEFKSKVRFTNKALVDDLTKIYFASNDWHLRAKIKKFRAMSEVEALEE